MKIGEFTFAGRFFTNKGDPSEAVQMLLREGTQNYVFDVDAYEGHLVVGDDKPSKSRSRRSEKRSDFCKRRSGRLAVKGPRKPNSERKT